MKQFFLKNKRLKLLALVFSTALWYFVAGQSSTEVGFLVPLVFKGIPKDYVMASKPLSEVEVRVSGPKAFINNLSPSQIIAEVDLGASKEGLNNYKILPKNIVTPVAVDVVRIRPNSVDVRLEKVVAAKVPVNVKVEGDPAKGYRVSSISVFPRTVEIAGMKKEVDRIQGLRTRPVDISGLDESTSLLVQLDIPEVELRSISANRVTVKIAIHKEERK